MPTLFILFVTILPWHVHLIQLKKKDFEETHQEKHAKKQIEEKCQSIAQAMETSSVLLEPIYIYEHL